MFRQAGVPYTIFVAPGFVERRRSAWWETIEAMLAAGGPLRFDFDQGPEVLAAESEAERTAAFERLATFVETHDEDEAVGRIDRAACAMGVDPIGLIDRLVMEAPDLRGLAEREPLADLGAHSMTHVNLKRVGPERLEDEVAGSARIVAGYGDGPPHSFAYPYGKAHAVGEREARAVAAAGFAVAVTTQPGMLGADCVARPRAMKRVSLNGHFQRKRHVRALLTGFPGRLG